MPVSLTLQDGPRCELGTPQGAPPAIPPIIITPFSYHAPAPAIDPRAPLPSPPIAPPAAPAVSCCFA